jgi:hypothetical protein
MKRVPLVVRLCRVAAAKAFTSYLIRNPRRPYTMLLWSPSEAHSRGLHWLYEISPLRPHEQVPTLDA